MQQEQPEDDFSLTYFFSPLNTPKALFIIVTVGLIVFTNGLFNGFVADDGSQIIDNPVIHSISNIFSFFSGSTFYNGGVLNRGVYYKPLLNTFFSFVYIVFGPVSFWFHFFQIGLHIANASILFLLLKRFFRLSLALFFSLVFLVHPINSEAVFYISASQEMLFFFFGMVALHILTKAQSQKQLLLATGFLLLSLLSKESGILFFGAALAYTAMFRRRYILPLLGYLSTAFVVYILLRIHAIGALTYPSNAPIGSLSLLQRLINTPAMFLVYLKTLFFPRDLSSSYQWAYTQIDLSNFLFPLLIDLSFIAIICSMASVLHKKHPKQYFKTYTFFAIWFFIGILLHLQIFPLDATAAERWFYFPIVGVLGMVAALLSAYHVNLRNRWSVSMITLLLLLLASRTVIRSFDWRDELTLVMHDIKISGSYDLENGLGSELIKQHKLAEAKQHVEKSIMLYPSLTNYLNLGVIYMKMGEYQKAKDAYISALRYGDYYLVYEGLAALTIISYDTPTGIKFTEFALKKFPTDGKLWFYLAILEYKAKNIDAAKEAITQAYRYNQDSETDSVYKTIMNGATLNIKASE